MFKEVCPAVADQILSNLETWHIDLINSTALATPGQPEHEPAHLQAGTRARCIAKEAPTILDEYANTSSAGSVIAFHKHRADLARATLACCAPLGRATALAASY